MSRHPAADSADCDEDAERDPEYDHGCGSCAAGIAALDPPEDIDGGDLRLEREVAGENHDRAELADSPRERERDAGEDRRQDARKNDATEGRQPIRAER